MSCGDDSGCCGGGGCGSGGGSSDNGGSSFEVRIDKRAPSFRNAMAYHKGKGDKDGFTRISLSDYLGKWVVLFFYPRNFTFVCPTEIKGFAKAEAQFAEHNAVIIGCSTDSEWSHKNWYERDMPMVNYPVVADTTLEISRAYGVLRETGAADRGLFVIDPEGIVKHILVSADSVGRSAKETLRVLKAAQSGDLCPMDWEEGDATLGKA